MLSLSGEIENKKKDLEETDFIANSDGFGVVKCCALSVKIKEGFSKLKRRMGLIDKKKLKIKLLWVALILLVVGVLATVAVFAWYSKDLPSPSGVVRREGYVSKIYDRNGELLYDVYKDAKRTPVVWEEIPDYLKEATVAIEDKDFYKHGGFDPMAPFRIFKNLLTKGRLIGGSTLTQQLVKNVLLTSERSLNRKIKEFILAVQIDSRYSKEEVLLMYLNEAPYGGSAWGVGSGAEMIFGKMVTELNLAESVILAGLPQRPNAYSPFSGDGYIGRSEDVLRRMVEDGKISQELAETTMDEIKNYQFAENKTTIVAPHFVFWIKKILAEKYGEDVVEGGGLKITTSLDSELQTKAQEIVAEEIDKAENMGISNGAALVLDPRDGEVLAMVGSRDYFSDKTDGKFNVVTQGLRQPGSAIKPITYLTAIKKGWTASSMIVDVETIFPGEAGIKDYIPQNYNGKFNGPMSLRSALGNSINVTAVKMLANVGIKNMLQQAYDMGISTFEPTTENMRRFGLAVTLGGAEVTMLDLATAYSSFANGGKKTEIVGILKVEDNEGRVLEEFKAIEGRSVMSPQEAFLISNILADNGARSLTFGQQNGLIVPNYQVAVKTGTTNDKRDNW
ncbi:penicillin-binding protein, partial [Patescibacteria group bacterium]|nr:penicillin-binding protein [Patescibacteria group bacterium]